MGLADGLAVPARAFAVDFVEEGLVELGGALEGGGEGGVGDLVVVGDEDGGLGEGVGVVGGRSELVGVPSAWGR